MVVQIREGFDKDFPDSMSMTYMQAEVLRWCKATFGEADPRWMDIEERCCRAAEENIELMQSLGMSKEKLLTLVEYVYERPAGEPSQEMGGTIITLAALANAATINMDAAFRAENERCWEIKDKIRDKQLTKTIRGNV